MERSLGSYQVYAKYVVTYGNAHEASIGAINLTFPPDPVTEINIVDVSNFVTIFGVLRTAHIDKEDDIRS
ncbi:unnamed protein product [Strongylus vulgaris]|uniref:Uncharacterized protein n=1 Tax=Strongylus vulgaris TaxID=40348 RepID=A0A3P7KLD2_STRVU|nr:unnamed protein product [Strongylus vulgaris]